MHGPLFHTLACALPGSSLYCLMEASMDYDLKTLEYRDQCPFSLYSQVCACYPAFQTLYCLKMHICIYVIQRGKQKDSTEFRIMAISRGKYRVCEWEDTGNSQQSSHTWLFKRVVHCRTLGEAIYIHKVWLLQYQRESIFLPEGWVQAFIFFSKKNIISLQNNTYLTDYNRSWQTFPIKGQIVNMQALLHRSSASQLLNSAVKCTSSYR